MDEINPMERRMTSDEAIALVQPTMPLGVFDKAENEKRLLITKSSRLNHRIGKTWQKVELATMVQR